MAVRVSDVESRVDVRIRCQLVIMCSVHKEVRNREITEETLATDESSFQHSK